METLAFKHEYGYTAALAGQSLSYAFHFPETARYLRRYLTGEASAPAEDAVRVSEWEFADWASVGNTIDDFAEFCLLCQQTSQRLLASDRCVFHAAAVRFRDRAWLIAAGSGVGKSTQCRNLMELDPEGITIINGDKPILEATADGVIVHPSPWNGKEGWHGAEAAPLAGLILLRRGDENAIRSLEPEEAVFRAFSSVFQSWQNEASLRLAAKMTEKIVRAAPIWMLTSAVIPDSTLLLYEIMQQEGEQHGT